MTVTTHTTMHRILTRAAIGCAMVAPLLAQQPQQPPPNGELSIQRIFRSGEFRNAAFPSLAWSADGTSYVELRANAQGSADVVRVDLRSGTTTTLATGQQLVGDDGQPIGME